MPTLPQTTASLKGLPAPAKINLFLHVIGRRPDGKHLLESVFILIDRADTIDLTLLNEDVIERDGDIVGDLEGDLCVRAARLLKERFGVKTGVRITLKKTIPSGAGLGGGSSDAATTLIGLNRLFGLRLSRSELIDLGETLGADGPFFIFGRPAFVQGIGEILTPVGIPPARYAVIWPGQSVSTGKIFSSPALTRDTESSKIQCFKDSVDHFWPRLYGHNDLQPVAVSLEPEIATALQRLKPFTEPRMTGSGSAVFGIIPPFEESVSEILFTGLPAHWIGFISESLPEHPLAHWLEE